MRSGMSGGESVRGDKVGMEAVAEWGTWRAYEAAYRARKSTGLKQTFSIFYRAAQLLSTTIYGTLVQLTS